MTSKRQISNYFKFKNELGTGSFCLEPPKAVGLASSRGQRLYQEDTTSTKVLNLTNNDLHNQCAYFGLFDGHGGNYVSNYLKDNLHSIIEKISLKDLSLLDYFKIYGDYFPSITNQYSRNSPLTLHERLKLAFLKADKNTITDYQNRAYLCGSTASVALFQSMDDPPSPYAFSKKLKFITAHCGDSAILLVKTFSGKVNRVTIDHHIDHPIENERLRKFKGACVTDSYGENRFLGHIANTRSIGDAKYKSYGVTSEPTLTSDDLDGKSYCLAIIVSDGILSVLTEQEIGDLARIKFMQMLTKGKGAQHSAQSIVNFAIDVGADDNSTAIVIPLPGFPYSGKGIDRTRDLRDYRLQLANDPDSGRQKRQ